MDFTGIVVPETPVFDEDWYCDRKAFETFQNAKFKFYANMLVRGGLHEEMISMSLEREDKDKATLLLAKGCSTEDVFRCFEEDYMRNLKAQQGGEVAIVGLQNALQHKFAFVPSYLKKDPIAAVLGGRVVGCEQLLRRWAVSDGKYFVHAGGGAFLGQIQHQSQVLLALNVFVNLCDAIMEKSEFCTNINIFAQLFGTKVLDHMLNFVEAVVDEYGTSFRLEVMDLDKSMRDVEVAKGRAPAILKCIQAHPKLRFTADDFGPKNGLWYIDTPLRNLVEVKVSAGMMATWVKDVLENKEEDMNMWITKAKALKVGEVTAEGSCNAYQFPGKIELGDSKGDVWCAYIYILSRLQKAAPLVTMQGWWGNEEADVPEALVKSFGQNLQFIGSTATCKRLPAHCTRATSLGLPTPVLNLTHPLLEQAKNLTHPGVVTPECCFGGLLEGAKKRESRCTIL